MKPVGIFGGTFDPIHCGHLRIALDALQTLDLQEVRFIPCQQSPLRDTPASNAAQRLAMLQRAVSDEPGLVIDERELHRQGPSYTLDTLRSLRADYVDTPLCLLLGMDAFTGFHHWHQWRDIFSLAHIIIAQRPACELKLEDDSLRTEYAARLCADSAELTATTAGRIYLLDATQLAISATRIRELVAAGSSARYLLPDTVWDYIKQHGFYQ